MVTGERIGMVCNECNHVFVAKVREPFHPKCPHCGSEDVDLHPRFPPFKVGR